MFKKAADDEDWNYIDASPAATVTQLPDDSDIHNRYLRLDETESLLQSAIRLRDQESQLPDSGFRFGDFPEFITVGINVGLRLTEMLILEFTDVDFDNEVLSVKKKTVTVMASQVKNGKRVLVPREFRFNIKNKQERDIRLNRDALVALLVMKEKSHPASDFVFQTDDGWSWIPHKRVIQSHFSGLVKDAGLYNPEPRKNVTIHTLRHTFGSQLTIAGVPLRKLQKLMGHLLIETTERYAHLSKTEMYDSTRVLEGFAPAFFLDSFLTPEGLEAISAMPKGGFEPPRPNLTLDPESENRNLVRLPKTT